MVLLERRFVPMVVEATTLPAPLTERIAFERLVKPRFVVVAFVEAAFVANKLVEVAEVVVELFTINPRIFVVPVAETLK